MDGRTFVGSAFDLALRDAKASKAASRAAGLKKLTGETIY